MPDRTLLAWVETRGDVHVAAFVGKPALNIRSPAQRSFASPDRAREWVETEAACLGLPVEWAEDVTR